MKKLAAFVMIISIIGVLVLYFTNVFPVLVEGDKNVFNRVLRYILYFVFGISALFSTAYVIADEPERKHRSRRSRRPRRR